MKYIIDTEFIDTPTCSDLISLAVLCEDGRSLYFEFDYDADEITPWLRENVCPHLTAERVTFEHAARSILGFVEGTPEFWCYYGAYDWYWFCRVFGGFMEMPKHWPMRYLEFLDIQNGVPDVAGAAHNALNDCRSILEAMRLKGMV